MSVFDSTAYSPRIGTSDFIFSDSPRINLVRFDPNRNNDVPRFKIPNQDGEVSLPPSKGGISILMTLEITTIDLSSFRNRFIALETALQGDTNGRFDFYLRYENGLNYEAYTNCLVTALNFPRGKDNPNLPALNARFDIEMFSEDSEPTVVEDGTVKSGSAITTETAVNLIGATDIVIQDALVIQNTQGDVLFQISAATGKFYGQGTVEFTL